MNDLGFGNKGGGTNLEIKGAVPALRQDDKLKGRGGNILLHILQIYGSLEQQFDQVS